MTYVRIVPLNRPVRSASDWRREYSQAERDANARYAAEQEQLHAEVLQQWSSPVPVTDDPEAEGYLEAANIEGAAFECWKPQREGYVTAAAPPLWVNHIEDCWLTKFEGDGVLDKQPTAASITLPFLMQGGEFTVAYESYKERGNGEISDGKIEAHLVNEKRLRVSSEYGIHVGHLDRYIGEMSATLVILPSGTPQEIADRVAAAYGRSSKLNMPEDYPVVMPLREHCAVCGRPFTDLVSRVIGIGPVCAGRLGVPYSTAYANHITAARQAFLSSKGE
jgi:hypothetical protein